MSHEQSTKKYVIAEQPDNPNQSDTKIRIKLFPVANPVKAPPPKLEDSLSSGSSEEDDQEEGEIISNAHHPLSMNIEEDSSEYQDDTPYNKPVDEQVGNQNPEQPISNNDFWSLRTNRQRSEQQSREMAGNIAQQPALPEQTLIALAMEAARRTNGRVLSNRKEVLKHTQTQIRQLEVHQKPLQNYLNSSNTHFKSSEYPVLQQDHRGRTYYNSNNNSFVVQQGTLQTFIQRNLTDETSYLEEVARYGNFAQQHTRKRRKHHFE